MRDQLFESPTPRRSPQRRVASLVSWLFIVFTLVVLGGILLARSDSIASGTNSLFAWQDSDGRRTVLWPFGYDGRSGFMLAAIEFAAVFCAAIGSCTRHSVMRHASLLLLLAWTAVWAFGALRYSLSDPSWNALSWLFVTGIGLVGTYARARHLWDMPPRAVRLRRPATRAA